jgi:DNA polymerase bacteriophage-type
LMTPDWGAEEPVFIDIETQSTVDLPQVGGRSYCRHPSTRVLSAVLYHKGVVEVWVPDHTTGPFDATRWELWDPVWGEQPTIKLYRGEAVPRGWVDLASAGETFVAHNGDTFDRFVWGYVLKLPPVPWADTVPLARTAGFKADLDRLSQAVGVGRKQDTGGLLRKLTRAEYDPSLRRVVYPDVLPGDLEVVTRYNVGDAVLLKAVWNHFAEWDWTPHFDAYEAHKRINERGVACDVRLLDRISAGSAEAASQAGRTLSRLTGGELNADNFRSTQKVHAWLEKRGVRIVEVDARGTVRSTLRKNVVEQCLANPWMMVDDDDPAVAVKAAKDIPPEVFDVLAVRSAAVRITGAKTKRAAEAACPDGRLRDLLTFNMAIPGRWSSVRVQIHNLPRGKKGIDPARMIEGMAVADSKGLDWPDRPKKLVKWMRSYLAREAKKAEDEGKEKLAGKIARYTVDDVLSCLVRPSLVAAPGHVLLRCDFSSVEACGVGWLADDATLLGIYRAGRDPYREIAARIFGVPLEAVTDDMRQVGKICILGMGYQMGVDNFRVFCGLSGVDLASAGTSAEDCVTTYRTMFPAIAGLPAGRIGGSGQVYFKGGFWDKLDQAAKAALRPGSLPSERRVNRIVFEKHSGDLWMVLPSGRPIVYRRCRVEDRIPSYCWRLGIEPRPKPTLVYDGPRGTTTLYGGKLAENCFVENTLVLTPHGWVPITSVGPGDAVWDGAEWVRTGGCVYRGCREVGEWLGTSVTADHLTTDGNSWRSVTHAGGRFLCRALAWARRSVDLPSCRRGSGRGPSRCAGVSAAARRSSTAAGCYAAGSAGASLAGGSGVGPTGTNTPMSCPTTSCDPLGYTGTPGLYHGVTIGGARLTRTTAGGGCGCTRGGGPTCGRFCCTRLPYPVGTTPPWNSTGGTTTGITSPATSDSLPAPLTPATVAVGYPSCTKGLPSPFRTFTNGTARGGAATPSTTTSNGVGRPSGLWRSTGSDADVYDLLDCGPRNSFTVLTCEGPIVVHNCTQGICNCLLRAAVVRLEDRGFPVVFHVHDEPVAEVKLPKGVKPKGAWVQSRLEEMAAALVELPDWADGFPIGCEGNAHARYFKDPVKGWPQVKLPIR